MVEGKKKSILIRIAILMFYSSESIHVPNMDLCMALIRVIL